MNLDFEHRRAAHCENGVTSNLLRFYGYDYSEAIAFWAISVIILCASSIYQVGRFPCYLISPITRSNICANHQLLGFGTETKTFFNQKRAMNKLDSLLEKGIPTGVVVGMYYLPYMPIEYRFHFQTPTIYALQEKKQIIT